MAQIKARFIGTNPILEDHIIKAVGMQPDKGFAFPSVGGEIVKVRELTFNAADGNAEKHVRDTLAPIAGVEVV